jgi:hypothetical protein
MGLAKELHYCYLGRSFSPSFPITKFLRSVSTNVFTYLNDILSAICLSVFYLRFSYLMYICIAAALVYAFETKRDHTFYYPRSGIFRKRDKSPQWNWNWVLWS